MISGKVSLSILPLLAAAPSRTQRFLAELLEILLHHQLALAIVAVVALPAPIVFFVLWRLKQRRQGTTTMEAQERAAREQAAREAQSSKTLSLEAGKEPPPEAGSSRPASQEAAEGEVQEKTAPTEGAQLRDELRRLDEKIGGLERQLELPRPGSDGLPLDPPRSPGLEARVDDLERRFVQLHVRVAALGRPSLAAPGQGLAADTSALERRIGAVELSLRRLQEPQPARPNGPAADASPDLELELAVLKATWERTLKELPFLASLGDDTGKALREELLCELPRTIEGDEELRSSCASVLAPVRELENLIRKVSVAQKLVEGTLPPLDQPARQLQRIREGATLLTMLHSSASFAERLNFRLEQWAGERFLTFADLFLQKRQQALLQGGLPSPALDDGYRIVLNVLAAADLVPIEIELGRTLFDSSQHVGRSTASQPGLRDGVIAGVVRNGFKRGGRVVRQPEVVVNRL